MEFTLSDIVRLYGKQLFTLPGLPSDSEEKEHKEYLVQDISFLTSGSPIDWKMKPGSSLALILRSDEFSNRELTDLLKQVILEVGIPTDKIGFGVLEQGSTSWNLSDMPVALGIVFENNPIEGVEHNSFEFGGKRIYLAGRLEDMKSGDLNPLSELFSQILND